MRTTEVVLQFLGSQPDKRTWDDLTELMASVNNIDNQRDAIIMVY
jgi:hypothetical protein